MNSINKNFVNKTIIMIAHRLSSLIYCDYIFRVGEGRILEILDSEKLKLLIKKNLN